MFCRPDGKNYTPKTLNMKLNYYLDKAELPQKYTIHTLRHSFATASIKKGVPPRNYPENAGALYHIYYYRYLSSRKS